MRYELLSEDGALLASIVLFDKDGIELPGDTICVRGPVACGGVMRATRNTYGACSKIHLHGGLLSGTVNCHTSNCGGAKPGNGNCVRREVPRTAEKKECSNGPATDESE